MAWSSMVESRNGVCVVRDGQGDRGRDGDGDGGGRRGIGSDLGGWSSFSRERKAGWGRGREVFARNDDDIFVLVLKAGRLALKKNEGKW